MGRAQLAVIMEMDTGFKRLHMLFCRDKSMWQEYR
jgi:hypothetical protein